MAGEFDTDDARYTALYVGVIVDNVDPECIGRVRIRIPGLIEPMSQWAFPLGTVGGGNAQRGFFAVPEIGSEVGVLFHQGDVDHPYYLSGHWGKPDGNAETPTPVSELSKEDAVHVRAFETKRFLLVFDDRSGHEQLLLKDKETEDFFAIKADAGISLKTAKNVSIEATEDLAVTIKGVASISVDGDATISVGGDVKLEASGKCVVKSSDIQLGDSGLAPATEGVVIGGGIDTFTGLTYFALQNASSTVKAKK
jgi:hypothetical protein